MPHARLPIGEVRPPSRTSGARLRGGYGVLSTRPLHILAFLSPLILLYELGSILYLSDDHGALIETIRAWRMLSAFFEAFGVAGFYLPGVALATVLLIWHFLERDRCAVRPAVLAGMLMESIGWVLPLLVLTVLAQRLLPGNPVPGPAAGTPMQALQAMSWQAKTTISIGAGLYEELLFRMILIAGVHLILVDMCKSGEVLGRTAAVLVSTAAFALYHDVRLSGGGVNIAALLHYLIAGLYFALLYLFRGFGIAAAVHALFDILVLILLPIPPVG
jgi:membrane protease YdiL (CAAX protease family)